MADEAAKRRELRRRRILENAEERKKKIFGTTPVGSPEVIGEKEASTPSTDTANISPSSVTDAFVGDDSQKLENDIPLLRDTAAPPAQSLPSLQNSFLDSRENNYSRPEVRPSLNDFRPENGLDPEPELTSEHLRNINSLLTGSGGGNFVPTQGRTINANDVQPATSTSNTTAVVGGLSKPIVPVIIALFVCVLLSVNLGYVVSSSIALPFLLWEVHHLWCNRHLIDAMSRGVGGLMGLALVLCGVQQTVMRKMTQVITMIKCFFEDFAFYILTIVVWHWCVGLPSPAVINPAPDLVQSETVQVVPAPDEDMDTFGGMDDF